MDFRTLQRFFPARVEVVRPESLTDIGTYADLPSGYAPTNPSLVPYKDGYLASVRGVNYRITDRVSLAHSFTAGAAYNSISCFMLLDRHLGLVRTLTHLSPQTENIEDLRLFRWGSRIGAIGARLNSANPHLTNVVLIELASDLSTSKVTELPSPYGLPREKNWCPFVRNDQLHFLYSRRPLVVLRYDDRTSRLEFVRNGEKIDGRWKVLDSGSSAGATYGKGELFLMHRRRVALPSMERSYVTRFCYLPEGMTTISAGPYFSIDAPTIQFANGLALERDHVLIAFGEMDRSAFVARFDKAAFLQRLLPRSVRFESKKENIPNPRMQPAT